MTLSGRMKRLMSDYEQVRKDFTGHKSIVVTPIGTTPPEKYHVTYFVNGIYLLPDGKIETLGRHEVEITLHSDYPRYKPICRIMTPIWHPNFKDGQICIGDIWGAGESLSDIIINIGDMIQYKSWNSYSPLSADAAKWAMENKHLFPVGNINLNITDYASAANSVDIDVFGEQANAQANTFTEPVISDSGNDFEITAEELQGVTYVPSVKRMQTVSHDGFVKGGKVNFKTVFTKGLVWALIGVLIGFVVGELTDGVTDTKTIAKLAGYDYLSAYYSYSDKADEEFDIAYKEYEKYCVANAIPEEERTAKFASWLTSSASDEVMQHISNYLDYKDESDEYFSESYRYEFYQDIDLMENKTKEFVRISTGIWSLTIALFIGLFLGIGEGIFYGSKEQAIKYGLIGAAISAVLGMASGYVAQYMYSKLLSDEATLLSRSFIRGAGWAIMGIGIGLAIGLIKPEKRRILFCILGGTIGAFVGGFAFNYICEVIPNDLIARGTGVVIMGLLIGLGVGLLEQFAKQAWLKVVRGEFEGKEYLVFAGTTSIGNNGKNTIVLFKDRLIGPHHCDIILEGSKYIIVDCGTPMGTVVNGSRIVRHILKPGDTISIGNSVLVFNTK